MEVDIVLINFAIEAKYQKEFDKFFEETIKKSFKVYPISDLDILRALILNRGD